MNAKQYLNLYGWKRCEEVAKAAGTNRAYFSHIAHGHRRPGVDLAIRLVEASNGEMGLSDLLGIADRIKEASA